MGKIAGKDVIFLVAGGSQPATDVNLNLSADELDVTNFESVDDWREFLAGFKGGEVSYSYFFDDTVADPLATFLGMTVTYSATFGAYTMSGNMVITSMELGTAIEDVSKWSISARMTGKPTEVTV
jgi:predicted secreted protein